MADINTDDWVDVETPIQHVAQNSSSKPKKSRAEYSFYASTADAALARLKKDSSPIFTVDLSEDVLWSAWLDNVDPSLKQRFTCSTCRHFIKRYGGLVQIDKNGHAQSLFWQPSKKIPEDFCAPVQAIHDKVSSASVLGEFKVTPKMKSAGAQVSGGYNHFYFNFPDTRLRKPEPNGFAYASVKDLATMLERCLDDYSLETVRQAHTILTEDKLPYADSHKAAIRWFLPVRENHKLEKGSEGTARHNLLYLHAATAFQGCLNQLRSGALSTLLEDLQAGKRFDEIKSKWLKVCDPLQYLRPQAAPTSGKIAAAERLMESLEITSNDLRRRQLTMSEVPEEAVIWATKKSLALHSKQTKPGGVFSELKPRSPILKPSSLPMNFKTPPTRMSFTKFVTDILPKAAKVEYQLSKYHAIYFCLTGLEGTKPLMQWHNDQNKASWFVYSSPRAVERHNLLPNEWNEVNRIMPFPHLWDGTPQTTTFPLAPADSTDFKYYHKSHGFRYLLCLESVQLDTGTSLCLFPSLLKSEFHGVRSTIEAYSNKNPIEQVPDIKDKGGLVAGVGIGRAQDMEKSKHLLRVTNEKGDMSTYEIVLFE
ncbi:hypothetical protein H2200_010818 [Cladophialophora chaetospira]|uniref:Uncharacterized protein n=1 Tax=Cladophialophora chaetospira TaxID=386627 RepID=A0AA38X0U2_9EURO|nr:hypothetical protein H2200_010818 [Cladophialophora chaetospira]